jgi:sortase A
MMDAMVERGRRSTAAALLAMTVAGACLLTACGGSGDGSRVEAATTTTPPTTTSSTSTTVPETTTSTSTSTSTTSSTSTSTTTTTSSTSTSTTTTTIAQQATQPIAPPADAYAQEPVIELGRIVIPRIGVDMVMYEGIRMTTLDNGPGHWPGSAMPGQAGNVVVGGHRTSKHKVFRNIDDLVAGDEIIYRDEAGEHVYIVNRVEVVEPTDVWIVNPTDTPTTTLFACHPPGSTRQRIVVFADLRV